MVQLIAQRFEPTGFIDCAPDHREIEPVTGADIVELFASQLGCDVTLH